MVLIVMTLVGALVAGSMKSAPMPDMPATVSAPAKVLPIAVYHAGPDTVAAYSAAVMHPDVLAEVPCLCGCQQSLGHRNNLDCYVAGAGANDVTVYSTHGIGCRVCQTITQLALDGASRGLSGPQLRDLVLEHFGVQS